MPQMQNASFFILVTGQLTAATVAGRGKATKATHTDKWLPVGIQPQTVLHVTIQIVKAWQAYLGKWLSHGIIFIIYISYSKQTNFNCIRLEYTWTVDLWDRLPSEIVALVSFIFHLFLDSHLWVRDQIST